jgi:hypothetical protein
VTATLDRTLERLRRKATDDAALADALELLAADDDLDDPFEPVPGSVVDAARSINARRRRRHHLALAERALTTAQVVELIDTISDRKAVDRRRQRQRLLGIPHGRTVLHPSWQFDPDRRDVHPGLPEVLGALAQITDDPAAADALMVTPRADLDGRTIADLLAGGNIELAVRIIASAGDQS